ncbi:hypothetical protein ACFPOB_18880 [Bosea eneae]|uniref:Uncharacterized protein n=1 Tax=Bosea eneae TaxID=151454 RepID=A0ABW0IWI6_9HYPH
MRGLVLGLLVLLHASGALACNGFLGVNYAEINARQILVEGLIRSVRPVRPIREAVVDHAFEIEVRSTLKGPALRSWTVLVTMQGVYSDWPEKGAVYIGFELVDPFHGVGRIRGHRACRPIGIVRATPENLRKIETNIIEDSRW